MTPTEHHCPTCRCDRSEGAADAEFDPTVSPRLYRAWVAGLSVFADGKPHPYTNVAAAMTSDESAVAERTANNLVLSAKRKGWLTNSSHTYWAQRTVTLTEVGRERWREVVEQVATRAAVGPESPRVQL